MDPPPSVAHVLDIMDDEVAVRYESSDIREFERKSIPSFRVLGRTEDIVDGPEDGELEGGTAGRMGWLTFGEALTVTTDEGEGGVSTV